MDYFLDEYAKLIHLKYSRTQIFLQSCWKPVLVKQIILLPVPIAFFSFTYVYTWKIYQVKSQYFAQNMVSHTIIGAKTNCDALKRFKRAVPSSQIFSIYGVLALLRYTHPQTHIIYTYTYIVCLVQISALLAHVVVVVAHSSNAMLIELHCRCVYFWVQQSTHIQLARINQCLRHTLVGNNAEQANVDDEEKCNLKRITLAKLAKPKKRLNPCVCVCVADNIYLRTLSVDLIKDLYLTFILL